MRPESGWFGLLLLFLIGVPPVHGQTPQIRTEVDTTIVTIGDRITLLVTVDHAPDAQVAWPDSIDLAPFEVIEARVAPARATGEGARSALSLTLTVFELGDLELPGFEVAVLGPGEESTLLSSDRFGIQVVSVGLDESGDIRDVRGPLAIPLNPTGIFLMALALVLAAGLLFWLRRRLKGGEVHPSGTLPADRYRPPHEIALESLVRLEASPLLERGEVKEFHIQVSEILRTYIEGRFRVPALEMTTADTIAGMERAHIEPSVREGLRGFLHGCDMVKFAKHRPSPDASLEALGTGRRLVETTIPGTDREGPAAEAHLPTDPGDEAVTVAPPDGRSGPEHAAVEALEQEDIL